MERSSIQIQTNETRKPLCRHFPRRVLLIQIPLGLVVVASVFVSTVNAQSSSIQSRLEDAAALVRTNQISEAERQLNSILKIAPNDAAALNLLGTVRAQQGRLDEAETLFIRATRADAKFPAPHMNLAFLYVLKKAPGKTVDELREVLRLEPSNAEATDKLARLLLSSGRIEEGISVIETAKQSQPLSVPLLVLLGEAYVTKGNTDKAEETYLLAISAQSNNSDAILGLARIAQIKGDTATAAYYLARARELTANSPPLLYKLGVAALKLGIYDEAQAVLEQAVKLKPDEASYLIALGATWLKKPDLFAAEKVFRRALELRPDNSQAQMYLGYVLYKQKKLSEATGYLEKSISTDTSGPEAFYYLGLIAQEQNNDERAIELFVRAVQIAPAFANGHVALGASYLKLKDYARAQKELELGAKLNPNDSKAHYQLALLYARVKDPKRAQMEMQIVEKLKTQEQSQRRESDIFVLTSPMPNPR